MEHAIIPGPPGLPILGNMSDIDADNPIKSLCTLSAQYGPIFRFSLAGSERIVIGSQALMNEVCDEERFCKIVAAALKQVRNGIHDGLFTAYGPEERNWGIAHRVLLPQLGPLSIRNMFSEMHDVASQLVMKWARHGAGHTIQVVDDFTRLTLDTIALCAMDYRFNSYYYESMHPFVDAMSDFLKVSGDRARRDPISQMFYRAETAKYFEDIELLRKTSLEVIKTRRENPTDKKDLLNGMMYGVDPKTGETMSVSGAVKDHTPFTDHCRTRISLTT
jgi:cytochrome P450/NADPH-cytochrome P450 reductase